MTTATARSVKVVDCDTHFWQPSALWKHLLEPRHRQRLEQEEAEAAPPPTTASYAKGELDKWQGMKAGDDPVERLKWMDQEGMYGNVIYPGATKATLSPDPEFAAAVCRALNRWAAEFASHAPGRLKPCMVLPMRHPELALAELQFARRLGLSVAFVPPTPFDERRWSDPALDPVWGEMEASGVVLAFHEFTQVPKNGGASTIARESYKDSYPFLYFCGHIVELQLALMDVIGGGVLDRFPTLKVGIVEADVAWLPGWLACMDSLWGWLGSFKTLPKGARPQSAGGLIATELFRRQCFITAFPDDAWIEECIRYVGEDNVVLCTDFPHPGTTFQMVDCFAANYPNLSESAKHKLLGGNAMRIFGFG